MDDEDRDAILKRRNRLIGLALAGLATVGCDTVAPGPCLEVMPIESPETTAEDGPQLPPEEDPAPPLPCLAPPYVEPEEPVADEPEPRPRRRRGRAAAPPEAVPMPCLSEARIEPELEEAAPQPCLRKS